jgi:HPt (histidine-containing phosphotransfer) domain-containing protein
LQTIDSLLNFPAGVPEPAKPGEEEPLRRFDRAALLQRIEGDTELLDEVLQIFLNDCPGMLEKIKRAAAERDAKALMFTAHALKGAAGNVCASRICAVALKLELMAKEDKLVDVETHVSALAAEIGGFSQLFGVKSQGQGA